MHEDFFDSEGNELHAANLEELYEKVQQLEIESPHDRDHADANRRELFSLALYLVKVAQYK